MMREKIIVTSYQFAKYFRHSGSSLNGQLYMFVWPPSQNPVSTLIQILYFYIPVSGHRHFWGLPVGLLLPWVPGLFLTCSRMLRCRSQVEVMSGKAMRKNLWYGVMPFTVPAEVEAFLLDYI